MRQRLHIKITGAILMSAAFIALVSSAWQYISTYDEELDHAQLSLTQLAETVQTTAAIACYLDNKEIADDVVYGLAKNDIVAMVRLKSVTGLEVNAGLETEEEQKLTPVVYGLASPFIAQEQVGQLTIIPRQSLIQARASEAAHKQTIIMGLNTFVVALLVMVVVYQLLIRPIKQLSADLSQAMPGETLTIDIPPGHEHDEIGSLTEDANRLLEHAKEILDAERTLQNELLRHREHLEELVSHRTAELQAETQRAESASKAKSEFLSLMSHELRTPLNTILGYGQLLQYDLQSEGDQARAADINNILAASNHLLSIIDSVLSLSQVEAGDMELSLEEFMVGNLLNELVEAATPLAAKNNNHLLVECPACDQVMHSDWQKLKQILLNILSNAGKFSKNSEIKLTIKSDGENAEYVLFSVTDHGIGISEENLTTLFQPFTQGDTSSTRKFEGTGLGLYLSKRLAEILHGSITVQSRVGVGSTFTVCLPRDFQHIVPLPAGGGGAM